jgi:hypothetical protein
LSRQSIIAPIGLITQPSEYGQYKRGALKIAKNVCMRSPGIIGSLPALQTQDGTFGASTTDRVIRAMHSGPEMTKLLQYRQNSAATLGSLQWTSFSSLFTAVTPPTSWTSLATAGCARMARMRERNFFTSYGARDTSTTNYRGVLVADSEGAATMRSAGLEAPAAISLNTTPVNAASLPGDTSAAWRVVFRRIQSDGYEIFSAPSMRIAMQNSSSVANCIATINFSANSHLIAGDIAELYRTATVPSAFGAGTSLTTDPGDVMYLAVSQVITSTDIANKYMAIFDVTPDGALGAELYTNQGQEGAQAPNYPPPHSVDMAVFKGHMFYAAFETPAQATIAPLSAFGNLSTDFERLYGIGRRDLTGAVTSGSPTITGVSNMRGVVVGQLIESSAFAPDTYINGVTATTITASKNSGTTNGSHAFSTRDQWLITMLNGSEGTGGDPQADAFVTNSPSFPFAFTWQSSSWTNVDSLGIPFDLLTHGASIIARQADVYDKPFTIRVTNGVNYAPPLPESNVTANTYSPQLKKNRFAWSKFQQPEHVPPLNFAFAGSGEIYRLIPTRDALWIFCSDGLHRLSGRGGDGAFAWREDMADPNLILAARNAVCVLKETVWCYTNRGLVAISDDGGIQELSLGVIGELPGASFTDTWDTFMAADEAHAEVWLSFRSGTLGAGTTTTYVFNTLTKTFVTFDDSNEYSLSTYVPSLRSLLFARVTAGSPPGAPFLYYFNADNSSSRLGNAQVSYQPLYVSDPFNLKQFVDVTCLFFGVNAAATLTPTFDVNGTGAVATTTTIAMRNSTGETLQTFGVPRRAAIAKSLRPGWQMSAVAAPWSFKGLSVRFTPGGDEVQRA